MRLRDQSEDALGAVLAQAVFRKSFVLHPGMSGDLPLPEHSFSGSARSAPTHKKGPPQDRFLTSPQLLLGSSGHSFIKA